ncbi:MAG: glycosyltransferase family 2 protein [Acidobacteriia bacterium]|nr:glycosyltransferase family 2 protein [Terriglobia bacterium]
MKPVQPGVSVVIPERDNPGVLRECLERVAIARRQLSEPCEVIVVVNGSPPSRYRPLVEAHPQVRWLFSKKPLWYCGAVRRGIRVARYDWVYLLNSDMILDASALASVVKWRSPRVFAVASQVFFRDPNKRREETGWTLFRETGGPIEILDEVPEDDRRVRGTLYAGGGASLFRRCLLEELARDSAAYVPFYWEDVEWGARAWMLGYESLYCPSSRAWHGHRMTNRLFFSEPDIDRILARNRLVFHLRNAPLAGPFDAFAGMLNHLDDTSLEEILEFGRMARIVCGHFQSCLLPADYSALEGTWERRYGEVDECVS